MKSMLIESALAVEAILFWATALPAAAVFFSVIALWEKRGAGMPRGPQLTPASS